MSYLFYNSALFVSSGDCFSDQTVRGSLGQLSRVQSLSFDLNKNKSPVQYSEGDVENEKISAPTVLVDCEYFVTNAKNESLLGFAVDGVTPSLTNFPISKNYYIAAADNNSQANYSLPQFSTVAIGNAYLQSYSINGGVGSFLTANFSSLGYNIFVNTGTQTGTISPALDSFGNPIGNKFSIISGDSQYNITGELLSDRLAALTKGDIFLEIPLDFGFGTNVSGSNSVLIQDFSLNISISTEEIYKIGQTIPSVELKTPIEFELNVNALPTKLQEAALERLCKDKKDNIKLVVKQPCSDYLAIQFDLKGVELERQGYSIRVNERMATNLVWKGYIGNINSLNNNVFITQAFDGTRNYAYVLDYCVPVSGYDENGALFIEEECFYSRVEV